MEAPTQVEQGRLNYLLAQFLINNKIFINKNIMSTKETLDRYLGKNTRITEKETGNGYKEVCDLDTGECYTLRMKDGLIERVDNTMKQNKKIQVETMTGVKQLLNG
jgi:hypothetical protein